MLYPVHARDTIHDTVGIPTLVRLDLVLRYSNIYYILDLTYPPLELDLLPVLSLVSTKVVGARRPVRSGARCRALAPPSLAAGCLLLLARVPL
jgi:hypothetical protein